MFLDARERCHQHGAAWLTSKDLDRITEGRLVQLQHGRCRLWARVAYRQGDHLTGTIADAPADGALKYGKAIRFEARHVIQTI